MSKTVPEGWEISPLGNLASVNWGNTSLTKASYVENGFPAFSAAGNDGLVTNAEHNSVGIVLSAIGARCGRTFLTPAKWTAIKNTIAILTDDQDIRYLFHVFNFDDVWNKSGGAQPFISLGDARKTPILHPPLPEQKKIASILTSVDDVIETTQRQIDKLQDLKKATMNELLTKGIGHTEFKDSELGRIPKSWEVVKLGDTGKWKGGGTPSKANPDFWEGDIPWVSPKDMKYEYISQTEDYVSDAAVLNSSANLIDAGAILVVVRSGILKHTLPVAISKCKLTVNQDMKALSVTDRYSNLFIYHYLVARNHQVLRSTLKAGNTVESIDTQVFADYLIPAPQINEQSEIAHIIESLASQIRAKTQKLAQTQALKKSLMQDLLTGKVRVQVN